MPLYPSKKENTIDQTLDEHTHLSCAQLILTPFLTIGFSIRDFSLFSHNLVLQVRCRTINSQPVRLLTNSKNWRHGTSVEKRHSPNHWLDSDSRKPVSSQKIQTKLTAYPQWLQHCKYSSNGQHLYKTHPKHSPKRDIRDMR